MTTRRQVILGVVASVFVPKALAHGKAPQSWTKLSQSKKNLRIVSAALAEVGKLSKLSCKEWVRKVVRNASDSHIEIKPNDTNNLHAWLADDTGHISVVGSSIENSKAGHLVQMILKSGWEHTAVIVEVNSSKKAVTFVDSNFDSTPADESDAEVKQRTITFTAFYASLKKSSSLTIYQVS